MADRCVVKVVVLLQMHLFHSLKKKMNRRCEIPDRFDAIGYTLLQTLQFAWSCHMWYQPPITKYVCHIVVIVTILFQLVSLFRQYCAWHGKVVFISILLDKCVPSNNENTHLISLYLSYIIYNDLNTIPGIISCSAHSVVYDPAVADRFTLKEKCIPELDLFDRNDDVCKQTNTSINMIVNRTCHSDQLWFQL